MIFLIRWAFERLLGAPMSAADRMALRKDLEDLLVRITAAAARGATEAALSRRD